jgi:hypothetical protein
MHKKFKNNVLKKKNYENVLIVGSGLGYIHNSISCFKSVFIVADEGFDIRAKNLIIKEDFHKVEDLPGISFIFMDWHQHVNIKMLANLILKQKPIILIEGKEIIPLEPLRWLQSHHYSLIEMEKKYHRWEHQCNIRL